MFNFKNRDMKKLFNDSDTFQKERPIKLTDGQRDKLYTKLAQEVIDEGYSVSDLEDVKYDLMNLFNDDGYEMAKELESLSSKGCYNINTCFIDWLDDMAWEENTALRDSVKEWVKAHNVNPSYKVGTELKITEQLIRYDDKYLKGDLIFINGIHEQTAEYLISREKDSKRNFVLTYEKVESKTELIK